MTTKGEDVSLRPTEAVDLQPGDAIVVNDTGDTVLSRPGAPARRVVAAGGPNGALRWVSIELPPRPDLTPDQRDALTALRDTVADDAVALAMTGRPGDAAIAQYAGQIRHALDRALGPRNP